jgi:hypothetical protein
MRPVITALIAAVPVITLAQAQLEVESVQIGVASTVAELDMGKLKGEPTRLAWSDDGQTIYVQTIENRGKPNAKARHYTFGVSNGAKKDSNAEPEWAAAYWTAKSGQAPADSPAMKIQVKTEVRQDRTTSSPMGGDLARGGASPGELGTTSGEATSAAYTSQSATVHSMVLKGQTIGEFVNSVIVPGQTFGWGPKGSKVIAFTKPKGGQIVLMDYEGRTRELDDTKDAILPAWSTDASRLAWLQKDGRRTFLLKVANVTNGS